MIDGTDLDGALRVVQAAASLDWNWTRGDVHRFCELLGWQIVDDEWGLVIAHTDLPVGRATAEFWLDAGLMSSLGFQGMEIEQVKINVAVGRSQCDVESWTFNAFASLFEALRSAVGEPSVISPGENMGALWRLPNVALDILAVPGRVRLFINNPVCVEWQETPEPLLED